MPDVAQVIVSRAHKVGGIRAVVDSFERKFANLATFDTRFEQGFDLLT